MELIIRDATSKTPAVVMDGAKGIIELRGRSIPENSVEFYKQLLIWLDEYGHSPCGKTSVAVQLEYFNTSSSKCLLDIFKRLELISKMGNPVEIKWYYEDQGDDIFESGEDYQAMFNLNSLNFLLVEM